MPVAQLPTDLAILAFRLSMVAALYAFLVVLVLLLRRDMERRVAAQTGSPAIGHVAVVDPGATGLRPGQLIPLAGDNTIGRDGQNSIVVADPQVSARHATLTLRDGAWLLRDLNSTNGTLVNQQRVAGEVALAEGDIIGIARVKLKLMP